MTNWYGAKKKAADIRKRYNFLEPPVNAFDLMSNIGLSIAFFRPTDETAGISAIYDKEAGTIYLNADENAQRQNFSLAHELAHHFLEHNTDEFGVYRRDSFYMEKPAAEKEADYFATELLMPEELVRKTQKRYGLTAADATALAQLFGVSPSAMRYRLRSLDGGKTT